jgi:hypothetical protein
VRGMTDKELDQALRACAAQLLLAAQVDIR